MLQAIVTLVAAVATTFTPTTVRAEPLSLAVPVIVAEVSVPDVAPEVEIAVKTDEVACNCYLFVSLKRKIPRMVDIVSNTTPHVGSVAIFFYRSKQTGETIKHIAIVESLDETGFTVSESNFTKCKYGKRHIKWGDPHLSGFYE